MLERSGTFVNLLCIEPDVFLEYLGAPLIHHCRLPRGDLGRTDYALSQTVSRMRRCQIGALDRIVRYVLRLRGVDVQ